MLLTDERHLSQADILVSVIVPIYNSEQYLDDCIKSIQNQTLEPIQIVLVNDGSSDNSGRICEEYAKLDTRITVLYKPNGGVSSARNLGLSSVVGKYIAFVDSDDYLETDFLQNAYNNLELTDSCLYISGIILDTLENGVRRKTSIIESPEKLHTLKSMLNSFDIDYQFVLISTVTAKLFRTDVLRRLRRKFDESMSRGEDTDFLFRYLEMCKTIYMTSKSFYHYTRGHKQSLSIGYIPNVYGFTVRTYSPIRDLMKKEQCQISTIERFKKMYINTMIDTIFHEYSYTKFSTKQSRMEVIRLVASNPDVVSGKIRHLKGIRHKFIAILIKAHLYKSADFLLRMPRMIP